MSPSYGVTYVRLDPAHDLTAFPWTTRIGELATSVRSSKNLLGNVCRYILAICRRITAMLPGSIYVAH